MATDSGGALDIHQILKWLPHRYPMLLVDRVTECVAGKHIRGIKNVTMNEPFFQGHFPGYPVMPGVLVIEALAQLSSILAWMELGRQPGDGSLIFFAGIDHARFRRQVMPGDTVILEAEIKKMSRGLGKFSARARVGDEVAAEAELMAVVRLPGAPAGN